MKLRFSPTSPFVRKVRVMVLETGLTDKVEEMQVNPMNPEDVKSSPNPLGKIPCLESDDGQVVFDSPVILDYLDRQHDGERMIPEDGKARYDVLRQQAIGDGMMQGLQLIFIESMRKEERQSKGWIVHNRAAVDRSLDALETEAADFEGVVSAGTITLAIALAFLDQIYPGDPWRDTHPKLAAWFDAFNQRPSMTATVLTEAKRG